MTKRRLGELLQAEGLVTEEQVRAALEEQRKSNLFLGEALVKLGFVSEEVIAQTIVQQFNLPFASALQFVVTPDILNIFPERMYYEYQFLAVDKIGKVLIIVGAGLMNHDVLDELERISGCKVHQYVSTWKDIRAALDKYAKDLKKEQSELTSLGTMLLDINPTEGGAPTLAPVGAASQVKNGTAVPGVAAAAPAPQTKSIPLKPAGASGLQPKVPSPPTIRPGMPSSASGRLSALSKTPNVAPKTISPGAAPASAPAAPAANPSSSSGRNPASASGRNPAVSAPRTAAPAPAPAPSPTPTPVPAGPASSESGRNPTAAPKSGTGTGLLGLFKKPG
jgi:hypothetical protein